MQLLRSVPKSVPMDLLWPKIKLQLIDFTGAVAANRTPDLLITNQLLYQLSYNGNVAKYIPRYCFRAISPGIFRFYFHKKQKVLAILVRFPYDIVFRHRVNQR